MKKYELAFERSRVVPDEVVIVRAVTVETDNMKTQWLRFTDYLNCAEHNISKFTYY
jgi:hypothetical protein